VSHGGCADQACFIAHAWTAPVVARHTCVASNCRMCWLEGNPPHMDGFMFWDLFWGLVSNCRSHPVFCCPTVAAPDEQHTGFICRVNVQLCSCGSL
jgi:hypothetical protein